MSYESLQAAHDALAAALQAAADGLPADGRFVVVEELADTLDPPAAVLAPPELTWEGPGFEPRLATWVVALVVPAGGRTVAELYRLLPPVSQAIHDTTDAAVTTGEPGTWQSGNTTLPAYLLRVEVAL